MQEWYLQVQHEGRREKVSLGTNNKEEACRRAAKFFKNLVGKGWDVALAKLNPDKEIKPKVMITVGELAHVAQYERFGGFRRFLFQYLQECINPGYPLGDLELEAKRAEQSCC